MKNKLAIIFIIIIGIVLYALTLRGAFGNPTAKDFKGNLDSATGAFELSPERGRYVHVVALAERGTYDLTREWADIAAPDVGQFNGKFYSYFAPGVPYLAYPFYKIGEYFGASQIATFFMTTSFYAAWLFANGSGWRAWLYASWVWAAYALAMFVDYPNAVMMLPVMIYFAYSTFSVKKMEEGFSLSIKWAAVATFLVFALITGFHFWHNAHYYGNWSKLSGTLEGYRPGNLLTASGEQVKAHEKTVTGFFSEEDIPRGFYILLFSDERGLFFFSPIFILAIWGIWACSKKARELGRSAEYILAVALILTNLALYSSWGDPWGGWAYGPR